MKYLFSGNIMKNEIKVLNKLREEKNTGNSIGKLKKRAEQGKMSARERIEYLFDPGTFVELQNYAKHRSGNFGLDKKKFYGDGVITGFGKANDKTAYIFSQDWGFKKK